MKTLENNFPLNEAAQFAHLLKDIHTKLQGDVMRCCKATEEPIEEDEEEEEEEEEEDPGVESLQTLNTLGHRMRRGKDRKPGK